MDLTYHISPLVNEMKYFYSAKTNSFYPDYLLDDYKKHGTLPEDTVSVTDDCFNEYSSDPDTGKIRVADENGMPSWGEQPAPTRDVMVYQALEKKNELRANADNIIEPLKDAKEYGFITEGEEERLKVWVKYRYDLSKVDVDTYPDIMWPTIPD